MSRKILNAKKREACLPDLNEFMAWLRKNDLSEASIAGYIRDLRRFAVWFEQTNGQMMSPTAITHIDLSEYRQAMLHQDRAASTVNRHLSSVKKYLRWALANGQIEKMPAIPKGVKEMPLAPKALDRKEQLALLRAVQREGNPRDQAVIVTLLETGIRVSELVSLRGQDLELRERSGKVSILGKGTKQREVPLSADARRALSDYLEARPLPNPDAPLFRGQRGGLTSRAIQYILNKYAYAARISEIGPHALRHTFATNLLNRGVDIRLVAALLGHKHLNTTMIYTKPSFQDLEKAVERDWNLKEGEEKHGI